MKYIESDERYLPYNDDSEMGTTVGGRLSVEEKITSSLSNVRPFQLSAIWVGFQQG